MDDKILVDKENMANVLEDYPNMIKNALAASNDVKVEGEITKIFITGMGESAFVGDFVKCFLNDLAIPIFVNKGYTLPAHVDGRSLVFCISYSGNTEETISSYRVALRKKASIVTVSSGGKLKELSDRYETQHIMIPGEMQPRLSTPCLFIPILRVLANSLIIPDPSNDLIVAKKAVSDPQLREKAKVLAERIKGKIPIIYSSSDIFCIAEKWKCDINENAKTPAFYNVLPEFNHNEIAGFTNLVGKYFVIIISDLDDHPRVKKRIKIIKKLIQEKGTNVLEIGITGNKGYLTRLLTGIYLGTWVSYYLALEYETDPTPVNIIENLKKKLIN